MTTPEHIFVYALVLVGATLFFYLADINIGFRWHITYTLIHGAMSVYDEDFYCRTFTSFGAYRKWVAHTAGYNHYTCRENRDSYFHMSKDIHFQGL